APEGPHPVRPSSAARTATAASVSTASSATSSTSTDGSLRLVPVREAVADDIDEICSLITALGDYEELSDQVVFDAAVMRRHLFETEPPAARVLMAETSATPPV